MNFEDMSKEELIKLCIKQDKALNKKKVERLSWKKIMCGQIVRGPDYWSNGHFLLDNSIEIPAAVLALKGLYDRTTGLEFSAVMGEVKRSTSNPYNWTEEDGNIVTENRRGFARRYINMLNKIVPGFTLETAPDFKAATIVKDGQIVGLLMPIHLKDQSL